MRNAAGWLKGWSLHAGLFLTTLSLLNAELLLTRIFSVTMWYHFAFMAISLGMFGLAAGAVLVHLRPPPRPHTALAWNALGFGISSVTCFTVELLFPTDPGVSVVLAGIAFLLTAIPFVFAGNTICIALTCFPADTTSLYAADLAGSAAACLLFVPLLDLLDAPSAIILNAALAAGAALLFVRSEDNVDFKRKLQRRAVTVALICGTLAAVNSYTHWVDVRYAKGGLRWGKGIYQKWNALSRIHVMKFDSKPFGWGLSSAYQPEAPTIEQLYLNIDGAAGTVITKFDGDREGLNYLDYDVTALPYHLRPARSALIIGVGGGRDVLTALRFDEKRIVGVEINDGILELLRNKFATYSGHLDKIPGISLEHDEARSYVTRSSERFAVIQASLIDTWAATAAGSYALSENGLYTTEAWVTFLNHLDPDGIFSVSRWYYEKQPAETLRLASLAREALMTLGVRSPRQHIMIIRKRDASDTGQYSVATLLVCRRPFTEEEIGKVSALSRRLDFVPVLTPAFSVSEDFAKVVDAEKYAALSATYPLNVTAPQDDSPFFFHMIRPANILSGMTQGMNEMNIQAVRVLLLLLAVVTLLSLLVLTLPLYLRSVGRQTHNGTLTTYFAAIGVAFMLMEIGQLERFTIFLGHPTYGMTVVLFALLITSSIGSAVAARWQRSLWVSIIVFSAAVVVPPVVLSAYTAAATPTRVLVALLLLAPTGFFMGMYLPLGLRSAQRSSTGAPLAWYWAVNGACSITASVLAIILSMFIGITATLLCALVAYVAAWLMLRPSLPRSGVRM